jgi:hypothetical protein
MKTMTTGTRFMIGTMFGKREVEVLRVSSGTVEFKWVGKFGVEVMARDIFEHKVSQ